MTGQWGSFFDEVSAFLAGAGIITLALFPLAVPMIALTAVALVPFLVVGLVLAVAVAPPLLIAGWLRRRAQLRKHSTRTGVPTTVAGTAGICGLRGCRS